MSPMLMRLMGGCVMVAAVATLGVALPEMATRLREHRQADPPARWASKAIADQAFKYRGDPVELKTLQDASDGPVVEVTWRGHAERLPVTGRDDPRLPELLRHSDWLRVVELAEVHGGETAAQALASGATESRLVVVGRGPTPEAAAAAPGVATARDWMCNFIELRPDGEMVRSAVSVAELDPRSWQHAAALWVTPEMQRNTALQITQTTLHPGILPKVDDGFSSLGWTWTAAGLAVLGVVVGAMMFGASFLTRGGGARA